MSNLYENPDVGRPLFAAEYDRAVDDGDSAFEGGVMRGGLHIRRPSPYPPCKGCGSATFRGRCFACELRAGIARVNAEIEARR